MESSGVIQSVRHSFRTHSKASEALVSASNTYDATLSIQRADFRPEHPWRPVRQIRQIEASEVADIAFGEHFRVFNLCPSSHEFSSQLDHNGETPGHFFSIFVLVRTRTFPVASPPGASSPPTA